MELPRRSTAYLKSGSYSRLVPYDVYDFTENRKRDGPAQFLANYTGYLQADAFSGYDGIYTGSDGRILEVACWRMPVGSSSRRGRRLPRKLR